MYALYSYKVKVIRISQLNFTAINLQLYKILKITRESNFLAHIVCSCYEVCMTTAWRCSINTYRQPIQIVYLHRPTCYNYADHRCYAFISVCLFVRKFDRQQDYSKNFMN